MNAARAAEINILVRVLQENPAALREIQQQIKQINTTASRGAMAGMFGGAASSGLIKFGKNVQWAGRQLEYRFTLPLVLAGAAAVKFANDNARAFTQLQNVYIGAGDTSAAFTKELATQKALFEAMSSVYGIAQSEVISIGVEWAKAGERSLGLGRSVKATLDVLTVAGGDYLEVTHELIALRQAFGLSAGQLRTALGIIAVAASKSAVGFTDYLEAATRAGATSRAVGVDIQHFVALVASMTPAAGDAVGAATALNRIFARLFTPTKQSAEVLQLAGINIHETTWQAANGAQRIQRLAEAWKKLTPAQRVFLDSQIGSRFQINRISVLLDDVINKHGRYQGVLDATANKQRAVNILQEQVNNTLKSSPKAFDELKVSIENMIARAIVPLIPSILQFIGLINQVVTWFAHLSPSTRSWILELLALLAILGPIVSYVGSFMTLFGIMGKTFGGLGKGVFVAIRWFLRLIGVLGASQAEAETTLADVEGAVAGMDASIQGLLASIATGVETIVAELEMLPAAMAAASAESSAGLAGSAPEAAAAGGIVGTAFDEGVVAALEVGIPIKVAAVLAEIAAMVEAGATAALAGGALVGTAFDAGITAALAGGEMFAAAAPALGAGVLELGAGVAAEAEGAGVLIGTAIVDGVEAPLYALADGAAAAFTDVIDVVGTEVVAGIGVIGEEGAVAMAGLAGGWAIALAAALGAAITFAVAKTSSGLTSFITGMWMTFFLGPIGFVMHVFEDTIWNGIKNVASIFAKLPGFIYDVLKSALQVVINFAKAIIQALSYAFNPWQRHSPSLVDLVNSGVDAILAKYSSLRTLDIGSSWRKAVADIMRFNGATKGIVNAADDAKLNKNVLTIAKNNPAAVPAAQGMVADIRVLRGDLDSLAAAYGRQLVVVNRWQDRLDAANASLEAQQSILRNEKYALDVIDNALNTAQSDLDKWSSAPLQGMQAMDDAIFKNQQDTKGLQLQLLKLEDTYGTIDGLTQRMSDLSGEMDLLSGQRNALRLKGAGSDVLAPFTDQINALQQGENGISSTITQMKKLQDEIDKLQHKGQELDLEKSLNFDGLLREIDQTAHAMTEMPFDTVIAHVRKDRAEVDRLTRSHDKQNRVVQAQQILVDGLQNKVDNLQNTYDKEKTKLDDLGKAYDSVKSIIDEMTSALDSSAAAAKAADDALAQAFNDAGAGNFKTPNLKPTIDSSGLDKMLREMQKKLGKFKFKLPDITAPFKRAWHAVQDWWTHSAWPWLSGLPGKIWGFLSSSSTWTGMLHAFESPFVGAWNFVTGWWNNTAYPWLTGLPGQIGGALSGIFGAITQPFKDAWKQLGGGKGSIPFQIGHFVVMFSLFPLKIIGALGLLGWRLINWVGKGFEDLLKQLPHLVGHVMSWFGGLPGRILSAVTGAFDFGGRLIGWVGNAALRFVGALPGLFKGAWNWFRDLPGWLLGAAGDIGTLLWKGLKGIGGAIGGALKDGLSGAWQGIKDWWNENIAGKGFHWHKTMPGPIPDINIDLAVPRLAKGGVAQSQPGGLLAMLGEAGRNEAILPLPSGFSMGMLAATLTRLDHALSHGAIAPTRSVTNDNRKTELHFHGDLSFPNVRDGDDAENFIRNLEAMT